MHIYCILFLPIWLYIWPNLFETPCTTMVGTILKSDASFAHEILVDVSLRETSELFVTGRRGRKIAQVPFNKERCL